MNKAKSKNYSMRCCWCSEPGTKEDPVKEYITSPPVSGFKVHEEWYHEKCAAAQAESQVI